MSDEKVKQEKKVKPEVEKAKEISFADLSPEEQAAIEKKSFDAVCKSLGVTKEMIKAKEEEKEKSKEMVKFDIRPIVVSINGQPKSHGICSKLEWETIIQMAGAKRERLLREKIGTNVELQMINGLMSAKIIGAIDESGLAVSV